MASHCHRSFETILQVDCLSSVSLLTLVHLSLHSSKKFYHKINYLYTVAELERQFPHNHLSLPVAIEQWVFRNHSDWQWLFASEEKTIDVFLWSRWLPVRESEREKETWQVFFSRCDFLCVLVFVVLCPSLWSLLSSLALFRCDKTYRAE